MTYSSIKKIKPNKVCHSSSKPFINDCGLKKKTYLRPLLVSFGDVRDLTLGGSPGGGDSGTPTTRRRR